MFQVSRTKVDSIRLSADNFLEVRFHNKRPMTKGIIEKELRLLVEKGVAYVVSVAQVKGKPCLQVKPTYWTCERIGEDDAEKRLNSYVSERTSDSLVFLNSAMA